VQNAGGGVYGFEEIDVDEINMFAKQPLAVIL